MPSEHSQPDRPGSSAAKPLLDLTTSSRPTTPEAEPLPPAVLRLIAWRGPILIAVAAIGMMAWTWGTWPDVQIDFGRELYTPRRIVEGDVLYRDIALFNGPLSQYFNALCFSVFGDSLLTIVVCNLAILALLIALLYYAFRQVSQPPAVVAACLVFVMLFAFAQFVGIGNYNYVCPYSHEVTHGLILSLLAVVLAWSSDRRCLLRSAASGLFLGLAFLTKAELFLPGAAASVAALALGFWLDRPGWGQAAARLACFSFAAIIPPAIAFVCLASAMPARDALLGTVGSWVVAVQSDLRAVQFHREGVGLDRPVENLLTMLRMTGVYASVLLPAFLLGLALRRPGNYRTAVAVAAFIVTGALLWIFRAQVNWFGMARPFPLLILVTILAVIACFWPHRGDAAAGRRLCRQLSLLVFAMVMLFKMFLNARISHYGFGLAMPAALALCIAALDWVPAWIERRGGSGRVFSAVVIALLLVAGANYLKEQARWISGKTERVGSGDDAFWADARGMIVRDAIKEIAALSSSDTTLAVFPEGVMLNYLTGLRNPTPYFNFVPGELLLFGEERMLDAFQAHAPDLVVLMHKDTSEYGFRFFGQDYGQRLSAWITANYRPVVVLGAMPLKDNHFGLLLMERKDRKPPGRR